MAAIGLIAACVAALGLWVTQDAGESPAFEVAEVVSFGSYDTKLGDRPIVVVRLAKNNTAQLSASPDILRGCRIGSRIRIVRNGRLTRVAAEGCTISTP